MQCKAFRRCGAEITMIVVGLGDFAPQYPCFMWSKEALLWRRSSLTIGNLHIEGGRPSFCNGGAAGCSKKPNPPVAACAVIIRMANWSKRLPVRTCFNSLIFNTAIPQICVIKQSVDLTGLGPVPSRRYLYLAIDQDSQGGPPTTANSRPSLAAASQKRWLVSSSKFKYIYIYIVYVNKFVYIEIQPQFHPPPLNRTSASGLPEAARKTKRPMRPKPLIPIPSRPVVMGSHGPSGKKRVAGLKLKINGEMISWYLTFLWIFFLREMWSTFSFLFGVSRSA